MGDAPSETVVLLGVAGRAPTGDPGTRPTAPGGTAVELPGGCGVEPPPGGTRGGPEGALVEGRVDVGGGEGRLPGGGGGVGRFAAGGEEGGTWRFVPPGMDHCVPGGALPAAGGCAAGPRPPVLASPSGGA